MVPNSFYLTENAFCWKMERWMTLTHLHLDFVQLRRVSRTLVSCHISSKIHRRAPSISYHTWKCAESHTLRCNNCVKWWLMCSYGSFVCPRAPAACPQSSCWQPKEPPYRVNHYIPTPTLIDYPHTKAGGAVNPHIGCRLRWQNSRLSL